MYDLAIEGHIELQQPQKINLRTVNRTLMAVRILQDLFAARDSIGMAGRMKAVAKLIKEQRGAVNEYFWWSDPFPILGLIYPLMVYIKHGAITPELLIGEKGMHKNDPGRGE